MFKAQLAFAFIATGITSVSAIPPSIFLTHGPHQNSNWKGYMATARELNPTFAIKDYDDEEAAAFINEEYAGTDLPGIYAVVPRPVMRADLFRLAVVAKKGGFYFDKDVLMKLPLEPLLANSAVFPLEWFKSNVAFAARHAGATPRDDLEHFQLGNYAFAADANHPFVVAALEEAMRRCQVLLAEKPGQQQVTDLDILRTTGPYMLSEVYHEDRIVGTPTPSGAPLHTTTRKFGDVFLLRGDDTTPLRKSKFVVNDWHKFGAYAEHMIEHSWVRGRRDASYNLDYELDYNLTTPTILDISTVIAAADTGATDAEKRALLQSVLEESTGATGAKVAAGKVSLVGTAMNFALPESVQTCADLTAGALAAAKDATVAEFNELDVSNAELVTGSAFCIEAGARRHRRQAGGGVSVQIELVYAVEVADPAELAAAVTAVSAAITAKVAGATISIETDAAGAITATVSNTDVSELEFDVILDAFVAEGKIFGFDVVDIPPPQAQPYVFAVANNGTWTANKTGLKVSTDVADYPGLNPSVAAGILANPFGDYDKDGIDHVSKQGVDATIVEASPVVEQAKEASPVATQVVEAPQEVGATKDEREADAMQASPSKVHGGKAKAKTKKSKGTKKAKKVKGSAGTLASDSQSGAAPASSIVAIAALVAGLAFVAIAKSTTQKATGHSESQPLLGIVAKGNLPSSILF